MDDQSPCVLRFALSQGGATRLFLAAAGGSELPRAAEAFRLRVALPIELAKAFGLDPLSGAAIGVNAQCFEEQAEGMRWIRWHGKAPSGEADKELLALAFSEAAGVPVFEDFELEGLGGAWAAAEAASASRDPRQMLAIYAALEAKALGSLCQNAARGTSPRL